MNFGALGASKGLTGGFGRLACKPDEASKITRVTSMVGKRIFIFKWLDWFVKGFKKDYLV
jgi:hypothetical protein